MRRPWSARAFRFLAAVIAVYFLWILFDIWVLSSNSQPPNARQHDCGSSLPLGAWSELLLSYSSSSSEEHVIGEVREQAVISNADVPNVVHFRPVSPGENSGPSGALRLLHGKEFFDSLQTPTGHLLQDMRVEHTVAPEEHEEFMKRRQQLQQRYLGGSPPDWYHEYVALHRSIMGKVASERRIIVYSGAKMGLGDQLVGIIQAFLLGVLTKRAVLIDLPALQWGKWVTSGAINATYVAADYEGLDREKLLAYNSIPSKSSFALRFQDLNDVYVGNHFSVPAMNMDIISELKRNPHYEEQLGEMFDGLLTVGKDAVLFDQYVPLRFVCSEEVDVLGYLYWLFLKPTPTLQARMDEFKNETGWAVRSKALVVHMRTGFRQDVDFKFDSNQQWFWECAKAYEEDNTVWLALSDSESAVGEAMQLFPDHIVTVEVHSRFHAASEAGYAKLWMDHLLIADANYAILSPSQFSRLAFARRLSIPHILPFGPRDEMVWNITASHARRTPYFYGLPCGTRIERVK